MSIRQRWIAPLALTAIMLLAGWLRFIDLNHSPPGLFRDEAEKGYNAWSLTHTGGVLEVERALDGSASLRWTRLPWMIDVMGASTSAIYQYASMPFIALGGLSVQTTRMAAACAGTLTVLLLGWTFMRVWGAAHGLAIALWLALSVWHLVFSRWALEGCFVPLLMSGVFAGLGGIREEKAWGWPLTGASMGWLFYAYSGAQPFVAAWTIGLLILYHRSLRFSPSMLIGIVFFLLPVIPTLIERLQPGGSERMARIAIWNDGAPPLIVAGRFIANYFAHFNPCFLFFSGDINLRHGVPGWGALAHADLLLVPWGIALMLHRRMPLGRAVLAALLCAPIPAALTHEGIPHALRAFAMVVPFAILSGLGLVGLIERIMQPVRLLQPPVVPARIRALLSLLVLLCLGDATYGIQRYFKFMAQDPRAQVAFQAGDRSAWETITGRHVSGEKIFIDARLPYVLYYQLFFLQPDPRRFAATGPEPDTLIYFDPQTVNANWLSSRMKPGDWLIQPVSARAVFGDAMAAEEPYTMIRQFLPNAAHP